jgi:hypothetical protein
VVARAMAGHFQQALALLDDAHPRAGSGRAALHPGGAHRAAGGRRLRAHLVHGVRIFADLVPSSPARPRARCHRGPGRAGARRLRARRVPPARDAAAPARALTRAPRPPAGAAP